MLLQLAHSKVKRSDGNGKVSNTFVDRRLSRDGLQPETRTDAQGLQIRYRSHSDPEAVEVIVRFMAARPIKGGVVN